MLSCLHFVDYHNKNQPKEAVRFICELGCLFKCVIARKRNGELISYLFFLKSKALTNSSPINSEENGSRLVTI